MLNPVSTINCPKCNHTHNKLDLNSSFFVCESCLCVYDNKREILKFQINKELESNVDVLKLGDVFVYNSIPYTITGKVLKFEHNDDTAYWTEYFLTNPENENIYLSEYNGHWNIVEYDNSFIDYVELNKNHLDILIKDIRYYAYHNYIIDIAYAIGEFNFNIFDDIGNYCHEYINPPYLLIVESKFKKREPLNYFKSTYLYKSDINKCLINKRKLPAKKGIVGSQPFYFDFNIVFFRKASIIIAIILLIIQLLFNNLYPIKNIKDVSISIPNSENLYVLNDINVQYDNSILEVNTDCYQLSNDWYASEMSLINNKTNEEYYFLVEAEYYQGYEDGESWSEGSNSKCGNVQNVAKGNYRLEIKTMQQVGSIPKTININIKNYKGSWMVFIVFCACLLILNIALSLLVDAFEHKKWEE